MRVENAPLPGPDVPDLLVRMRRRRRRRLLVATSAAPAVAAILALAALHAPSNAALVGVTTTDQPTATPSAPAASSGAPSPSATATAAPEAPAASPDETADPTEQPDDPSPAPTPEMRSVDHSPLVRRPVRYEFRPSSDDAKTCDQWVDMQTLRHPAWCTVYAGQALYVAGVPADLPVELCRSQNTDPATAYPDSMGRWLSLRLDHVGADGNIDQSSVWTWREPSAPDQIAFAAGDCARWTIPWSAPVAPGDYRLMVSSTAKTGAPTASSTADLTVTG